MSKYINNEDFGIYKDCGCALSSIFNTYKAYGVNHHFKYSEIQSFITTWIYNGKTGTDFDEFKTLAILAGIELQKIELNSINDITNLLSKGEIIIVSAEEHQFIINSITRDSFKTINSLYKDENMRKFEALRDLESDAYIVKKFNNKNEEYSRIIGKQLNKFQFEIMFPLKKLFYIQQQFKLKNDAKRVDEWLEKNPGKEYPRAAFGMVPIICYLPKLEQK